MNKKRVKFDREEEDFEADKDFKGTSASNRQGAGIQTRRSGGEPVIQKSSAKKMKVDDEQDSMVV
jgi:hypothetical protein